MYVNQDIFDMLRRRLHKDSIVWEKQGRKNLYLTDKLTFNLKDESIIIIGIKSMGDIVGFLRVEGASSTVYNMHRLYNRHLTRTQELHLDMLMERYDLVIWRYCAYHRY